ncbi:MAG: hypothetical protein K2K53_08430 [Oscillospiraceae bacterium]|nr:hypothetical protein [Oscillospiraceae bacterium]
MEKYRKTLLLALKIGAGTSIAIYIAQALELEYAVSAGTVTLLTLMMSKWATVKLSVARLATFCVTILLASVMFPYIDSMWIAYGLLLTLVVFFSELLGWRATISVNAVVAVHLLTSRDFSAAAIRNEFLLVLIGVILAVVLNLFNANFSHRQRIISNMRDTEKRLQTFLRELAADLSGQEVREDVWQDIFALEAQLQEYKKSASEYQDNTFHSHPEYYISYFEMRSGQCRILRNLHDELARIRSMPRQAAVISDYILYLSEYVIEINQPTQQIARLEELFADMREEELPKSRDEFENRAMLYHILMDIQDFLTYKADFVSKLDQAQLTRYWNQNYTGGGVRK